jgi:hypothetical protein
MLRVRRSTRVTTSVSPGRRNSKSSANSVRPARRVPEPVSVRTTVQPAARRACSWRAQFCSAVDTRAYP